MEEGKCLKLVFMSLLLDLLGFTLILPLFPSLLDYYSSEKDGLYAYASEKMRSLVGFGASKELTRVLFGGFLGSLFSFLQFLTSPLFGSLSDHYGRRPILLLSESGIAFSYLVWMWAGRFEIFVLARVVGGLFKGNVSLFTAVVTDVTTYKTRARGMALIGMAFSLGFILGPCIGAGFSYWAKDRLGEGEAWYIFPAGLAFLLALGDLLFLYATFEETLKHKKRSLKDSLHQGMSFINPISLFRSHSLKSHLNPRDYSSFQTISLVNFFYLFLYSGLEFTLTFLTHLRFSFTSVDQGKMFLFTGVVMAFVQGAYVRKVSPGDEKITVLRGLLIIIPAFAIVGLSRSLIVLYLGLFLYSISTALIVPCLATLVSYHGEPNQKGIIMGIYRSLGALGRALGPIFASTIYWILGPDFCYCLGGLGLLVPYILLRNLSLYRAPK